MLFNYVLLREIKLLIDRYGGLKAKPNLVSETYFLSFLFLKLFVNFVCFQDTGILITSIKFKYLEENIRKYIELLIYQNPFNRADLFILKYIFILLEMS